MWRRPVVVREDMDAILAALFDIKSALLRITWLLGDDDGEEEDPDPR
jgi:hypothetical protein